MSKKVHVFNAGPCLLPQVAIDHAIEALKDFSARLDRLTAQRKVQELK